jgi:hypothetical protein
MPEALRATKPCVAHVEHSRYRPRRHPSQGILIHLGTHPCDVKELHDSQIYYLHHQVAPRNL